jgi:hypothetical protein
MGTDLIYEYDEWRSALVRVDEIYAYGYALISLYFSACVDAWLQGTILYWLVGLFLLLPLGAQGIRETLRFISVS